MSLVGGSLGSMLCPAAVSATVFTGSGMVFGYASQVFIFAREPDALTILGSTLMLLAVVIMTVFRVQAAAPAEDSVQVQVETSVQATHQGESADDEDAESFISFAASEFAEFEGHTNSVRESLRFRSVQAQSIGSSLSSVARAVGDASAVA